MTKNASEILLAFDDSVDHKFFHVSGSKAVTKRIAKAGMKVKKKCK